MTKFNWVVSVGDWRNGNVSWRAAKTKDAIEFAAYRYRMEQIYRDNFTVESWV